MEKNEELKKNLNLAYKTVQDNRKSMKELRDKYTKLGQVNKKLMQYIIKGIKVLKKDYTYSEIGEAVMGFPKNNLTMQKVYELLRYYDKKNKKHKRT